MSRKWANTVGSQPSTGQDDKSGDQKKEKIALFLQGGGALGAYQGGAFAAMAEAHIDPDWVSGISIGAINAAIIAGNKPEDRAEKLWKFWKGDEGISTHYSDPLSTATWGVPRYFAVKIQGLVNLALSAMSFIGLTHETSVFDPSQMYKTLPKFVDFDYLNNQSKTRLSVGAVDIENGELVYFDSRKNISMQEGMKKRAKDSIMRNPQEVKKVRIGPEHIMASGALIPNFPTVEIGGHHFCDGGLVSNTPVRMAYETGQLTPETVVIRADLWSRKNKPARDIGEAAALAKAIQFSSPPIDLTGKVKGHIHIACPNRDGQSYNKDFDFSHHTISQNWDAGYKDMKKAIEQYRTAHPKNGTIEVGNGHGEPNGTGRAAS